MQAGQLRLLAGGHRPDPVGDRRLEVARQDDVLLLRGHPGRQPVGGLALEAEERRRASRPPPRGACGVEELRVGGQQVARHARREDDRAGPVVDRAALGRDLVAHRRLLDGHRRQLVAADDLPVREARAEAPRHHHEGDEQEERAGARVGPAEHRWGRR